MRITNIKTFKFSIDWIGWLFVRIDTDEGICGWGEGSLHGALESVEMAVLEYADGLIGKDPAGPETHWYQNTNGWRWRGGAVLSTAISAIDIALWDLEGKRLGVPVHRLLGGKHRERLPAYASHWLIGARTPEETFEGAREACRRGFKGFKWNPISFEDLRNDEAGTIALAADKMAAAREGAGDTAEIYIECGEFLSPRTASMLAKALSPYRPAWFEEPVPFENAKVMAQVQRDIDVPVACGERLLSRSEFRELFENAGCKVAQPDIMHAGGFTEIRKIAAMAETYCIPIAPHNPGGPICMAATMQFAAAIPNFLVIESIEPDRTIRNQVSSPTIVFEDGCFVVPDRPGLGIDLDLEALKELSFKKLPKRHRLGSLFW